MPYGAGKVPAAGLASSEVRSNSRSRRFPVTLPQPPVTRCQICHRTVAYRPGNLSEVLTGHYRRAIPKRSGSLPGSRPRKPSALSADAATSLPTPDELARRARPEDASGHGTWPIHGDGTHEEPPKC
jgi:hypothetical protein